MPSKLIEIAVLVGVPKKCDGCELIPAVDVPKGGKREAKPVLEIHGAALQQLFPSEQKLAMVLSPHSDKQPYVFRSARAARNWLGRPEGRKWRKLMQAYAIVTIKLSVGAR